MKIILAHKHNKKYFVVLDIISSDKCVKEWFREETFTDQMKKYVAIRVLGIDNMTENYSESGDIMSLIQKLRLTGKH